MRITHILKAAGIAGAERHLLDLLDGLRRDHGHDARAVMLAPPGGAAQPLIDAARARDIPTTVIDLPRSASPGALAALIGHLRAEKPDLVHTHMIHADLYGTLAARLAGVRRVFSTTHNTGPHLRRWPVRLLYRALWPLTERGVCVSDAVRRYLIEQVGAPTDKLTRIHHGLPLPVPRHERAAVRAGLCAEIPALSAEGRWVGAVSRLIDAKGLNDGLDAFAQLTGEFPDAHLFIAGDGPLRADLELQAARLGLAGRVHFLGWRDDAPRLMAALDVYFMPSLREGFGMTLLEAMAQAVPVVSTTVDAVPEVVSDGVTGFTVPPADARALAAALRRLLSDSGLRAQMGAAGLARLNDHFSAAAMVAAHAALYADDAAP